ncbi:MAG TPA: ABC transporter ATP-binding protein [Stellaceae bacterium]|jgi:ABC-type Fe3+/spermidine/putrescine transport system ATPase subunit|nr:ABC transporter ATP-binding protein [Stellaceae bacterium]
MAAITLNRLRKQFGPIPAVRDISVTFEDGKMTSVLGPSGCGKTTTLNMIAGFVAPDSGSILFGETVVADPARHIAVPSYKRQLGMVFQSYALWPHLSIAENVGYGLKMRGVGRAERERIVRRSLARVRLEAFIDRFPHELSGGQQQRVALARAIAYAPQILLFDEPLSNLDAQLREEMRDELKALHSEIGVTAVYVTHDQAEAMSLSDTIIVMGQGEILQSGTPRQLYEEPADIRVASFIGKTNLLNAALIDGSPHPRVQVAGIIATICCRAPGYAAGAVGSLSIRPEGIRLAPWRDGRTPEGTLSAHVSIATYLGETCHYELRLGDGRRLEAHQPALHPFAVGDTVAIEFDPEHCYFIAGHETLPSGEAIPSCETTPRRGTMQ